MRRTYKAIILLIAITSIETVQAQCLNSCWSLGLEGGYSISTPMDFKPDYDVELPSRSWIVPASSSFDQRTMNTSPLLGALLGYQLNPFVNLDLHYTYRWDYEWDNRFSLNGLTPEAITAVGERYVLNNIKVHTLLLEMNLIPRACWCAIHPFATVGAGIGWIRTGALRNYDLEHRALGIEKTFDSYLEGKTENGFAWDIGAGIDYNINTCLHVILGYRFVDVRKMATTGNARDTFRFPDAPDFTVQPFKARHVQFHEPYIELSYHI